MRMADHVHQWKRFPVVSFSVLYGCTECNRGIEISWMGDAHRTLGDLDAHFIAAYGDGGVFAGEMIPQPSPEENMRRAAELLGADLPLPWRPVIAEDEMRP
jgi:hypothetical protein